MRLILASSSPRRQQLLKDLGLSFAVVKPDIDESLKPEEKLVSYVERLSREKAEAVARQFEADSALIIAADTIVVLGAEPIEGDGELLGKPADPAAARAMLRRLRGRAHAVVTAFTLLRIDAQPQSITRQVRTTVHMRDYTDAEIESYIASGDPFDKAGAYAIQNVAFRPVARIEGSYSNVVGLPMDELKAGLSEIGCPTERLL